jgi:hypothetical protein
MMYGEVTNYIISKEVREVTESYISLTPLDTAHPLEVKVFCSVPKIQKLSMLGKVAPSQPGPGSESHLARTARSIEETSSYWPIVPPHD